MHGAAQAASQQTPCAQLPEAQSLGPRHGCPSARGPQLKLVQVAGDWQPLAAPEQLLAQLEPSAQA